MSHASIPAVVLLSGGLDSTTLLHHVARDLRRAPVYALSVHYGQRHARELACARAQAEAAGAAEHRIADLSGVAALVREGTALVEGSGEVPDLDALTPEQRDQPPTYVPNRNMTLLAVAAAYAEAKGVQELYYGAQAMDEYGYWDCTGPFVERLNAVLALNRRQAVRVLAPFAALRKSEALRIGLRLGVDYAQTWSCYRGGDAPCLTCPTCIERHNAFSELGAIDPLVGPTRPGASQDAR